MSFKATIKIDKDLWESFKSKVAQNDSTSNASEVIRQFIERYINDDVILSDQPLEDIEDDLTDRIDALEDCLMNFFEANKADWERQRKINEAIKDQFSFVAMLDDNEDEKDEQLSSKTSLLDEVGLNLDLDDDTILETSQIPSPHEHRLKMIELSTDTNTDTGTDTGTGTGTDMGTDTINYNDAYKIFGDKWFVKSYEGKYRGTRGRLTNYRREAILFSGERARKICNNSQNSHLFPIYCAEEYSKLGILKEEAEKIKNPEEFLKKGDYNFDVREYVCATIEANKNGGKYTKKDTIEHIHHFPHPLGKRWNLSGFNQALAYWNLHWY